MRDNFKAVYQTKDREEALETLEQMQSKWEKSYPRVIESVMSNELILTFYNFPASIRRSIYRRFSSSTSPPSLTLFAVVGMCMLTDRKNKALGGTSSAHPAYHDRSFLSSRCPGP